MKLITRTERDRLPVSISLKDKVLVLGSCFADEIGTKMKDCGMDVCVNPFGTLYNPASIASSLERIAEGKGFTEEDCIEMGAGAGLICSFSHHTSFAAITPEAFIAKANASLEEASSFWKECNRVVITLGTAMVWKRNGEVVSNCLKRPAREFTHEMLDILECRALIDRIKTICTGKDIIFTVSPIRHLSDGAHKNTLSKSTLHLSLGDCCYFPAYEILNDELRDYRFYADDLNHPSRLAVEYIWDVFLELAVPAEEHQRLRENEKAARRLTHRPIH